MQLTRVENGDKIYKGNMQGQQEKLTLRIERRSSPERQKEEVEKQVKEVVSV